MFESADWSKRSEHITKHGVTPGQADEAIADPNRVVINPDPSQKLGGRSVRIIGFSTTARTLITVIIVEHEGTVFGATAFKSNTTDQNRYAEKE